MIWEPCVMSNERRKFKLPGGWPRRGGPPPATPERRHSFPGPPGLSRLPKGATGFHMLEAVQRSMLEMQAGGPNPEDFGRRLQRLQHLISTHPKLSLIRPSVRKLADAVAEHRRANPDLKAQPDEAALVKGRGQIFQKVFDGPFTERLAEAMMEALLNAKSSDDADALVVGSLYAGQAKSGESLGENTLLRMLVDASLDEAGRAEEFARSLGMPSDPAEIERLVANPAEMAALASDPERERRLREAMKRDPAIRRHSQRLAEEAKELFYQEITRGGIEAHLTAEELLPLFKGVGDLGRRFGSDQDARAHSEEIANGLVRLLQRFAEDPKNRPAYERFDRELKAQADRAAGPSDREALRLRIMARMWQGRWPDDPYFRIRVAHASTTRLMRETLPDDEPQ